MAINSDPSNWVTATLDAPPAGATADSDPSAWVTTTIQPEAGYEDDSVPSAWVITTLDPGGLPTGLFIVDSVGDLIEVSGEFP